MSLILALDSSTDACSVALYRQGVVDARFELATKSHTQRLLPMVDELLVEHKLRLVDLDAIAFGCGPGSFTGLRICMGVVQGLAYGTGLPVIPISTLQAMAYAYMRQHTWQQPVLAALDARMGEVYWGLFQADGQGMPQLLIDEQVLAPELLPPQLHGRPAFAAVGSGFNLPAMAQLPALASAVDVYPRAEEMALLAAAAYARGAVLPIDQVQPVYLRDTVSWQKRQRIRQPDAN